MDSYIVDFDKLNNFLEIELKNEDLVILDGHVSHLLNPDYIIVLRSNPENIKQRLEIRKYSSEKIMENIEAEILDVCLVESIENNDENIIFEIDCTDKTPDEITDEIISFLNNKKPEFGNISWLEEYFYLLE